jgi:predicted HTH transcriptional regulator
MKTKMKELDNIEDMDICVVEISKSNTPVYIHYNGKEEFYIRASASSQPLGIRESNDYISIHWND